LTSIAARVLIARSLGWGDDEAHPRLRSMREEGRMWEEPAYEVIATGMEVTAYVLTR
jgi:coenzyme PQQ precursor peptide PqqA